MKACDPGRCRLWSSSTKRSASEGLESLKVVVAFSDEEEAIPFYVRSLQTRAYAVSSASVFKPRSAPPRTACRAPSHSERVFPGVSVLSDPGIASPQFFPPNAKDLSLCHGLLNVQLLCNMLCQF